MLMAAMVDALIVRLPLDGHAVQPF